MHPLLRLAYSAAGGVARGLTRVAPASGGKIAQSLGRRRRVTDRFEAWGRTGRDRTRPLLWMHAPSVGEGLQARPVLELARQRRPDLQLAYTFFSPSAERLAAGLDVDFADYLPFDTPGEGRRTLAALQPSALVFAKLDVWPLLCEEAQRRAVPLALVSATLSAASSRRSSAARALLGEAYAMLDAVGAISPDDAERLVAIGAKREVVQVTGDTRFDQVAARAAGVDRTSALLAPFAPNPRPTLVAGSTWPADERVLLPAWERVRDHVPGARLVIAPHEPTEAHLAPIERWGVDRRVDVRRLGAPNAAHAEVVLVDRVGVLGDLYVLATAAFVGGGFHDAGLHSVLEPAAFGAPVAFGPRHRNAREAELLVADGGGVVVRDVAETARQLIAWLGAPGDGARAGALARAMVEGGRGGAERNWRMVEALLPRPSA